EPRGQAHAALDDLIAGRGHHHPGLAHRAAGMRAAADGRELGVAGDHAHTVEIHAEPLHNELGKARLVALAGRQRADDYLDALVRPHADDRALPRRPGVELAIVGHADAAIAPPPARLSATRLEALPARQPQRA